MNTPRRDVLVRTSIVRSAGSRAARKIALRPATDRSPKKGT